VGGELTRLNFNMFNYPVQSMAEFCNQIVGKKAAEVLTPAAIKFCVPNSASAFQ